MLDLRYVFTCMLGTKLNQIKIMRTEFQNRLSKLKICEDYTQNSMLLVKFVYKKRRISLLKNRFWCMHAKLYTLILWKRLIDVHKKK